MSGCKQPNESIVAESFDGPNKVSAIAKHVDDRTYKIIWYRVILIGSLQLQALYGLYLVFSPPKIFTLFFALTSGIVSGVGITAGAHRLWSHRSYKAKLPLRILLLILHTMTFQYSIINWARDHRVHHKYSDTNADPHNVRRGFFFAHIGWLLCQRHPENIVKSNETDMSDLESDPLLRFQHKYYYLFMPIVFCIVPMLIPIALWNETLTNAWFIAVMLRYAIVLHVTFSVNSFAHLYGNQPYDRFINPVENKSVAIFSIGEGWHNYHHTFPWDYKAGELGNYRTNVTALFIDCMAKIGWAYDLKTVAPDSVKRRIVRTGDGTYENGN